MSGSLSLSDIIPADELPPHETPLDIQQRELGRRLLGKGVFASVYDQGDGTCLKVALILDGTAEFIRWCHAEQSMGDRRPHSPAVMRYEEFNYTNAYGTPRTGWCCVMPIMVGYREAMQAMHGEAFHFGGRELWTRGETQALFGATCCDLLHAFELATGHTANDVHEGSVLWWPSMQEWVVVDPCSEDSRRNRKETQ